ncbi:winged helix-turn-helix domain-containing protein [Hypericibacter sp.]|uniref:winged helix-turn-helix domain-containing protein n=1 Tax=Hypericibacter sp. TaxID=2705401 RepID=UPI003D6D27CB
MKILLIEDDAETAGLVADGLRETGYTVEEVRDGREGLVKAIKESFDVLVVDIRLPNLDGLSVVRLARAARVATPILFLTTMDSVADRVRGLKEGGDDYLVKPFALAELCARVDALARRRPMTQQETTLSVGDLVVNLIDRSVVRGNVAIELLPREFQLLEYLMRNTGQVVTKKMLLEKVWKFNFDPQTNVIETHISRLRTKIDKPFGQELLHTIRGVGYMLDVAR